MSGFFLSYALDSVSGLLYSQVMENTTPTPATAYIVRSAINPSLILCTNGEFLYEGVIGPGHDIGAKTFKTRRNAEKVRGGYKIIVEAA